MDCAFGNEIGLEEEALCLRKAEPSDLDAVAGLEAECFPKAEAATKEQFQERLKAYGNHFLLLFLSGRTDFLYQRLCQ
jgi:possible acetyltransferase